MKKMMCVLALSFCAASPSFGRNVVQEFDQSEETICHEEIKALGCTNSRDEEISKCIDKKLSQLSTTCKNIHNQKKN